MEKNFLFLAALLLLSSCSGPSKNAERMKFVQDSIARAEFVRDSIARVEFVKDSIEKVEHNKAVIAKCEPKFTHKKDEFSDVVWVTPKSAPKYRNMNGVYCYFATENGIAKNFRFVFQYHSDEWLFIHNMIFNIDGENITISPSMETDCGYGGKIWEWCDVPAVLYSEVVTKIANSNSVKVKMNGRQYYDTRTLSSSQIASIKETYEYFLALGGEPLM